MSSTRSVGYLYRLVALTAVVAVAAFAGAQEKRLPGAERFDFENAVPQKTIVRAERAGDVAPLLVQVPNLGGADKLVAELVIGERPLVRETIQIAGSVRGQSAVRLMASHGAELANVRKIAETRGDELTVRISAGERVLVTGLFRDLDAAGKVLVGNANVVGAMSAIDVYLGQRTKAAVKTNGMEPDPECESYCNQEYQNCMEWRCDQRGSCEFCWDEYENCVWNCPKVCVDPKKVSDYQRYVYLSTDYYGNYCLRYWTDNHAYPYNVYKDHYRVETVRKTEYCDGSYSEQVISSYNTYSWCYWQTSYWPCNYSEGTIYQRC